MGYYAEHTVTMRSSLGRELPLEVVRELHERSGLKHFLVVAGLVIALVIGVVGAALAQPWYFWLPFSIIAGFALFNFTILLHEVVHSTVMPVRNDRVSRWLGWLYAVPSGISATQFTRWHLDHHAELGSAENDPKRHHLSPKINARWLKLLYFTPALFLIYFRAAAKETATYPEDLQRRIRNERILTIIIHVLVIAILGMSLGWWVSFKAWIVPYFFVFPFAFALNRLGQHYDIVAEEPEKWATLVRGSRFWDVVYLCSNYHLEHHYFPGVPLYNLPRLQRLLAPWYENHGMKPTTYSRLFWDYIILNRPPHTNWGGDPAQRDLELADQS